jgi:hypothetical protein
VTEPTTRWADDGASLTAGTRIRRPDHPAPSRPRLHLSYATWEYSIELDYAALTVILDAVLDVWDRLEDDEAGEMFEALVEHIAELRRWTGWAGVPGEYTGDAGEAAGLLRAADSDMPCAAPPGIPCPCGHCEYGRGGMPGPVPGMRVTRASLD